MTIEKKIDKNTLTVIINGRIDSTTSAELSSFLENNFKSNQDKIILDFTNVDFISSKGLRVLITLYKTLNGREMEIIGANTAVKDVLRLADFLKVFNVK